MEGDMGTQCYMYYEVHWMVGDKANHGFENFHQSHHLDSLGILVVDNTNDRDDGGMLGVDIECYAYYRVHWLVGGNTNNGGRLGSRTSIILRNLAWIISLK